jgi:hypothetical protein
VYTGSETFFWEHATPLGLIIRISNYDKYVGTTVFMMITRY